MDLEEESRSGARETPAPDAVQAVLERILASVDFANAPNSQRFLKYVVEEALAGRSAQIKAVTIAEDVFGRSVSKDDTATTQVRVEARAVQRSRFEVSRICHRLEAKWVWLQDVGFA